MISLNAADRDERLGIDPFPTEFQIIESEDVLTEAAQKLNLDVEWGAKYNHGTPLDMQDTITRLRHSLTLRQYNEKLLEIRASTDNPKESAQIANAIATADCNFHMQDEQAFDFATVQIAGTAIPQSRSTEQSLFFQLGSEIIWGAIFSFAAALAAGGLFRVAMWVFGIKNTASITDSFEENFAGKIVGVFWLILGAILSTSAWLLFLRTDWLHPSPLAYLSCRFGAFWTFSSISGLFLIRGKSWAKIYLILAAVYTALPLSMSSGIMLPPGTFRWDFAFFGIGTICALLLPQDINRATTEIANS